MDHDELTGGMEGLSVEVVRGAAETEPGGEGRVFVPMTEVVERKFSGGKQFRPTVGGERNVGRRENGDEVVLSCLHSALSFVGPMDEGGNVLEGKRGMLAAKQGG